jgi:hypothetical protein
MEPVSWDFLDNCHHHQQQYLPESPVGSPPTTFTLTQQTFILDSFRQKVRNIRDQVNQRLDDIESVNPYSKEFHDWDTW